MEENLPSNIIRPPSEIRDVIKKTAWYVAKKGIEFEYKIKENELNNLKFSFLNSNDPYYNYYSYYRASLLSKKHDETALSVSISLPTPAPEMSFEKLSY